MEDYEVEEVLDICIAYEKGYLAGQHMLPANTNNYDEKTKGYYAWLFGHNSSLTKEIIDAEEILPN